MTSFSSIGLALVVCAIVVVRNVVKADCFTDGTVEDPDNGCCMFEVCGLPCPEPVSDPSSGFAVAVCISIAISFLVGIATFFFVKGKSVNFFVAGRSLPLWVVVMTLAAQSIDSNALLGNADLSYKYHFWDGAVLPIGLGLSLLLNGLFLAAKINQEQVLTLPDVFARRYGVTVEVMISCCTIVSFLMLLAGNLVGMGVILSYVLGMSEAAGIWMSAILVWAYTVSGGLFSVAYTDVAQGLLGWSGCFITAMYLITTESPSAPPPSRGFPGYVYPDTFGDGGACDLYDGEPCMAVGTESCCYNATRWCDNAEELQGCLADNGAYPVGDQRVFSDQMTSSTSLTPFPNAFFWDWCTIFILGFGNLGALDFQARCMASKTPQTARIGCLLAGLLTFFVGIPFAYLGAIARQYYGPDSVHAEFEPDTCSEILGLPTCAQWLPNPNAFIMLLTHQAPKVLGAWCLIGIVAASMSTSDGAILAMGTVFSHNLLRHANRLFPDFITAENLLAFARLSTIPFTLTATLIAAYYRSSHSAGATGYLLIVAFDVVLATVVVPLFAAFYTPGNRPSPAAAFWAVLSGALVRVVLEFTLPKDGFLLLPFRSDEYLDYGSGIPDLLPVFFDDAPENVWNPAAQEQQCVQQRFADFTGVDSLASPLVALLVYLMVVLLERATGPITMIPGTTPYEKKLQDDSDATAAADKEDKENAFDPIKPKQTAGNTDKNDD